VRASIDPAVRDAVFIFGPDGARRAGSRDADRALGDGRIDSIDEFVAQLRQSDGTPLDLHDDRAQVAVRAGGSGERRFVVTVRPLDTASGERATASTCVVVHVFAEDEDPATTRRILGSILAHELRTPMTTIFGGAQLIADPSVSSTTRTEAARSVAREAQRLHRVIEDLLVFVRSRADEDVDVGPVLLQRVIPRVVGTHQAVNPGLGVEATIPKDLPPVLASERDVEHVVDNLLSHAVRYNPQGATVRVEARRRDGEVEVRVFDDGPARDADEAERAFELFTRSGRSTIDPSGANLSLVVSRLLVERMGGRIWAGRSKGAELGFALPEAESSSGR
jgi:signal transduction histidine kinase